MCSDVRSPATLIFIYQTDLFRLFTVSVLRKHFIRRPVVMGRRRRMKFKRSVVVLSPIQELSGEFRSPTPVNDVESESVSVKEDLSTLGAKPFEKIFEEIQDNTDREEKGTRSGDWRTSTQEIVKVVDQTNDCGDRDHLMTLAEEYQNKIIKAKRQLRQERESNTGLRQQVQHYKTEHFNYELSLELDQAEIQKLKDLLVRYDEEEKVLENIRRLEEENKNLKEYCSKTLKENTSLRKIPGYTTGISTVTTTNQKTKVTVLPRVPQAPAKDQRRPYTGKSRATHLPSITENNKVVASPQQIIGKLPSITSFAIVPKPPSCPRQSSSRRHKVSCFSSLLPSLKVFS